VPALADNYVVSQNYNALLTIDYKSHTFQIFPSYHN